MLGNVQDTEELLVEYLATFLLVHINFHLTSRRCCEAGEEARKAKYTKASNDNGVIKELRIYWLLISKRIKPEIVCGWRQATGNSGN